MGGPHDFEDLTAPERFCLPASYRHRPQPKYFTDDADDITWQPDVYPHAADLARHLGRNAIIDIGSGRAGKPAAMRQQESTWQYIDASIDLNIKWYQTNYTFVSLDPGRPRSLHRAADLGDLSSSVLMPRPSRYCHSLHVDVGQVGNDGPAVLSTPARKHRAGADYLGQPRNPAHVSEWTSTEFTAFVTANGFSICDVPPDRQ